MQSSATQVYHGVNRSVRVLLEVAAMTRGIEEGLGGGGL